MNSDLFWLLVFIFDVPEDLVTTMPALFSDRPPARCAVHKGLDFSHAPGYELILGAVVLSSVVLMAADFHFTGLVSGSSIGSK